MRLGFAWIPNSNANYRAIEPMKAMMRRGHEVVPPPESGEADLRRLATCDAVHIYRRADPTTQRVVDELLPRGIRVTFDNDDDLRTIPKESPDYKKYGGLTAQRLHAASVKLARRAHCFTTTNEVLAKRYRDAGVERIAVIPNMLDAQIPRPSVPHDGFVVGWVGGVDHRADVARIPVADALRRLVAAHDHVRVHCIGVDLGIPERYTHESLVRFRDLPRRIGGFDIGIAPLAELPANRTRSDIKLKEYAASGVPWLASPRGPYAGLGEGEGGRLVADAEWYEAVEALVSQPRKWKRLSRAASAWARTQTVEAVADRWERVFAPAAGPPPTPSFSLPSGAGVRIRLRR